MFRTLLQNVSNDDDVFMSADEDNDVSDMSEDPRAPGSDYDIATSADEGPTIEVGLHIACVRWVVSVSCGMGHRLRTPLLRAVSLRCPIHLAPFTLPNHTAAGLHVYRRHLATLPPKNAAIW